MSEMSVKKEKSRLEVDLLQGNIVTSLLIFAVPLFISNVFPVLGTTSTT